jgi:hypothetical protein
VVSPDWDTALEVSIRVLLVVGRRKKEGGRGCGPVPSAKLALGPGRQLQQAERGKARAGQAWWAAPSGPGKEGGVGEG